MWIVIQNKEHEGEKSCCVIDDSIVESFYISNDMDTIVFYQEDGAHRVETLTGKIVGVYSSLRCAHRIAQLKVRR